MQMLNYVLEKRGEI